MELTMDAPRSELEHLIDEWILKEKYRIIIKRRLLDGITYDQLAEEVEMSPRQVKEIVKKCEKIIFSKLD